MNNKNYALYALNDIVESIINVSDNDVQCLIEANDNAIIEVKALNIGVWAGGC